MQPRLIVTLTKVSELSVQLQNCMHTSSRDAGDGFVEVQLEKVFLLDNWPKRSQVSKMSLTE